MATDGSQHQPRTQRQYLGAELRRARELAGISGRAIAARVALSQSTVSRVEAGDRVPTMPEVTAWLEAVEANPQMRERLLRLTESAHTEIETYRHALAGVTHLQARAAEMETSARALRSFEPVIVPGLLQTAEYARRAITLSPGTVDVAAALAARLDRQRILYQSGRRFEFLITESALRWPAGPADVMQAQMHRLLSMETLQAVKVGVLPLDHKPSAIGWHEFTIYEDATDGSMFVHTELSHVMLTVNDPTDVDTYVTTYRQLAKSALFGKKAVSFIQQLADNVA